MSTIGDMKRRSFGRDRGLSLRMLFTSGLLGLLYVAFAEIGLPGRFWNVKLGSRPHHGSGYAPLSFT